MFAIVQVRGIVKTRRDIKDTLAMLRLHHINHCVVVPDTPEYLGMIRKVKDFVAYGEVDAESLGTVLSTRGRLVGNRPLTDEYVKANSPYATITEFADAVAAGKAALRDLPGLKPVMRLHPPRKGHRTLKRTYQQGGALGSYGRAINTLLYRMR
ncbi:MAG: 50S ribosomal protein L30 [Methanomicrobiales archaeon]|nr:50S ribosomal protein L30 [Methanomicrobiales archaeon]